MNNSENAKISDEEASKIFDEILKEDELGSKADEDDNDEDESELCAGDCSKENITDKSCKHCAHLAENSSRFSVRVMEAMRRLQEDEDALIVTSSVEDIVEYIEKNYPDDGDLYSQVRTALKQVCSQGFVMELLDDEYHLIGPDAISMNQATCSNQRRDCFVSSTNRRPKQRKRNDDDDDCECDLSSKAESIDKSRNRKCSLNGSKNVHSRQRNERTYVLNKETPDFSRESTITFDECVCEDDKEMDANDDSRQLGRSRESKDKDERRTRMGLEQTLNLSRRRGNNRRGRGIVYRNVRHSESAEGTAQAVDNIYEELRRRNPRSSIRNEQELKAWIERCQEECKRRRK